MNYGQRSVTLYRRQGSKLFPWKRNANKTIPMEKKCKKAKWLSGEVLQIAVKRRKAKAKEKRKDISI